MNVIPLSPVQLRVNDDLRRLMVGLLRIATICDGQPTPAHEFDDEETALLDEARRWLRERGVRDESIGV